MKFDEIGVLSFGQKIPAVLINCGFKYFTLDVLSTFSSRLTDVFQNLLRPLPTLTGKDYEILNSTSWFSSGGYLWSKTITPSIKQVVVYVPYYIAKAREDGDEIGLPLTLEHI